AMAPMAAIAAWLIPPSQAPSSIGRPIATATAKGNSHGRSLRLILTSSRSSRLTTALMEARVSGVGTGMPNPAAARGPQAWRRTPGGSLGGKPLDAVLRGGSAGWLGRRDGLEAARIGHVPGEAVEIPIMGAGQQFA